ncbi:hypothetical protein GOP47_0015172 [Adiantum capillus-veneris]|uniref:L-dopachrome isomerase n=1 Tax=Adiantum capillus-veneris TaxID=13818 RepID=A0A9D4UNF8_ADICA|nr:hypothetical protein GOP47_0015172 [Adiantum capillus-veneris]
MPTLNITTNVPLDGVSISDILRDASRAVATTIGKPEQYVMVLLRGGVPVMFAGSEEPAAYGEIVSIGGLSPSVNKTISSAISEILESKLSIPKSRFYLKFSDVNRPDFGWNGSTF